MEKQKESLSKEEVKAPVSKTKSQLKKLMDKFKKRANTYWWQKLI